MKKEKRNTPKEKIKEWEIVFITTRNSILDE